MADWFQDRAHQLAREAADLDPPRRSDFIARACTGDDALRKEVERLLASRTTHARSPHSDVTVVPDGPAPSRGAGPAADHSALTVHPSTRAVHDSARRDADDELASGTRIGSYRLLRPLGEGGMGLVYLAEQSRTRQPVALKLIRPGLATARLLRRFEHEVQVLGLLQHPGIARIYEAGTADTGFGPQPFFAMEFVEGRPLTEHAAENKLDLSTRLELMIGVCHAVQHAHQKGVVHRDLKPANILVGASGQAKVLDFGVARAVDGESAATLQTEAGQLVGTLGYMSPEQIAGDPAAIDTRSDVYSLGVVLYELLSGRLPHDVSTRTLAEAVRLFSESDGRPLRDVAPSLPSDVSTIVDKALERDRERRYQAASDLAADLQRFLNDEPITARPPSTVYQLRKFARRHSGLVAASLIVLAVVIAGVIGTAWQALVATRARDRAVAAEVLAEQRRLAAEADAATARAITGFLSQMLRSADPENTLGREVTVREIIDSAAASADTMPGKGTDVEASVRGTLAETYRSLGAFDKASEQARRALELRRTVDGPDSRAARNAARLLGGALSDSGKLDEAAPLILDAEKALRESFGERDPDAIQAGAEVARLHSERGELAQAEAGFRTAIERSKGVYPNTDLFVLTSLHNLATNLKDQGKLAEAEDTFRRTLSIREQVYSRRHPQTLFTMNNLAAVLARTGKDEEAESLLRETLRLREELLGPLHPSTITTRQALGTILIQRGKLDEAEPLARQSCEQLIEVFGEQHTKSTTAISSLGYLLEDRGKLDEAETQYRRALKLIRANMGLKHPETFPALNNLASLLQRRQRITEALAAFDELIAAAGAALPADHYLLAIFRNNRGDCLRAAGRLKDAEADLLASHEVLAAKLGPAHARTLKACTRLTTLYTDMGDPTRADEWKQRAQPPKSP